jgi:hypothetical protein
MLDYGPDGNKYNNMSPFPLKKQYTIYHVYKKGVVVISLGYGHSSDETRISDGVKFLDSIGIEGVSNTCSWSKILIILKDHKYIVEEELHSDYQEAMLLSRKIESSLEAQWRQDIKKEYDLDKRPAFANLVISHAYQLAHSSGLYAVENELSDLLDFLRDVEEANKVDASNLNQ